MRCRRRSTDLERRLISFRGELLKQNPLPQACPKGPGRAICIGKLSDVVEAFDAFIRDRTAYYMDGNIFRPLTELHKLSYAELVGPMQVEWFVSHFWGSSFRHFVETVQHHAEDVCSQRPWQDIAYWICFCSNNQYHIGAELGADWTESSFYLALQSGTCKGTCMVLDRKALPLTRSWCIFEVLQTLLLERSNADFGGLLLCTSGGVLNYGHGSAEVALNVVQRVATMDLSQAAASSAEDKAMINKCVEERMGGFLAMHGLLRGKLHEVLVTANDKVQQEFGNLFTILTADTSARIPELVDTSSSQGTVEI